MEEDVFELRPYFFYWKKLFIWFFILHKNRQYLVLYDYSILYYSVLLKNI